MVELHGARVVPAVATNPETPPTLLEDLSTGVPPVGKALRAIARHPNASGREIVKNCGRRADWL